MSKAAQMVKIDVPAKLAYEWTRTGRWSRWQFITWLQAKRIDHECPLYTNNGTLIHRATGDLAWEWVKTKCWNFRQFQAWLNSYL
jgi:hypothetical protein